jgi:PAS domain S-box-containing protein
MESGRSHRQPNKVIWNSPIRTVILVCAVAVLSYLVPWLVGALLLHPHTVWPFWPGCALLVTVLLLVPRKIWPMLIAAAFAGIVLYDLHAGVPISSLNWFIPADTVEVLIAAFTLNYFFAGIPRLDSVNALAKYSFFAVLLAPFASAFLSALGIHTDYWTGWRIGFFSEVLAFVALVPAILGWIGGGPAWAKKSATYYFEGVALLASLGFVGYFALAAPGRNNSPVVLCSLVPWLLWSALRFGSMGASTSVFVIAFFSIWGAVHGRGPFTEPDEIDQVLSLDLFLFFAAAPFMVLAALVEERKRDEEALTASEERLLLATQAGRMFAYEWDASTDVLVRSEGSAQILGIADGKPTTGQEIMARVHADDRDRLMAAVAELCPQKPYLEISYRLVRPNGSMSWVARNSLAHFDERGRMLRIIGMVADITERKQAEQALQQSEAELSEAQRLAGLGSWQWDTRTDTVTWSEELYCLIGLDLNLHVPSFAEQRKFYTSESWERLNRAVAAALQGGRSFELDVEIVRSDFTTKWVIARGEVLRGVDRKVIGLRGTVQDITERKLAQEKIRKSEERLRLAVQAGRMFACDWDAATDVFARSAESAQILGIDETTPVTGREILSFIHPDDRGKFKAAADELSPEEPDLRISHRMIRPDGSVIWVERNSRAHFDEQGRLLRIVGIVADITERKKAERELVQTSDRLRLAMEAGKCVGWEWDIKSGRDTWFGDLQTMFGISSDTFVGRADDFYRYVHPEDRKLVSEAVGEAKRSRNPYSAEFRIVWPDGTERWISSKGKFEYSPEGEAERMFGMAVDITEQRRAQESLRLFRRLIDQSNDAIEVIDPETLSFLDVNDKDCRELGYTREELLSLQVSDIDPTLNETSHAKVRGEVEKSGFAIFESIHRRKDGSTFPVEVNAKRVELDRTYYVTVVRDISERKQAEEVLRESEERLRLAVRAGRMYAFEWDLITDVIVRSGESNQIFNWTPSPTIDTGRQFIERVHPDDRETYLVTDAQLTAADPFYQISYRIIRPDGSVVWLEDSGHAYFDGQGKMLRIIGMVADVTERKLAEEALRESEQRFRLVANSTPVMIWMSGTDKMCNFFNEGWLNFTGRSMEQELGDGWASSVHPEDLDRCLRVYSEAFDARLNFEMEYRLRRFDGEYRWILDYGVPRFGADGTFCGYIGSCVDITDRKLSERSVLELSGRLIHAQEEERARIARELHDDLSQRIALLQIGLDQFEQDAGALPSQGRRQLHRIAELAGEVSSGIHGLSHQLHPSKLDTLGLLPSLGALCKELSSLHNLQVQFVHRDIVEPIPREVTLCVFRIVQEALRNVVKHSGASGAEVELWGHADRIDLLISDSGAGFNPEAVNGGTGLGLVSMRERLRLLGGQLLIESKPECGTQIRVRVPLSGAGTQDTLEQKHYEANA